MAILRNVPMAEYLANENVSHSGLKDFSISPRLFQDKWLRHLSVLEEDDEQDSGAQAAKESRALLLGRAFETLLTQPKAFDAAYICKPATGPTANFSTKEGKEWKASALARGLEILTPRELASMRAMRESFEEHPQARHLLEGCEEQVTFTATSELVTLQSRPDFVNLAGSALSEFRPYSVDLKTVDHMERFYNARAPLEYGYHRQAAIARICMEANGAADSVHYLLACEKSSPNRTELFELDAALLEQAETWVYARIPELAECLRTGIWPRSRSAAIRMLMKPKWLQDEEV